MTAIKYQNGDAYNETSVSTTTPLPVAIQVGGVSSSASNPLYTLGPNAGAPTYVYTVSGYTAYATPTDMVGISGSATKTIKIINFWIGMQSTAAALQTIHFVKRSTANTGGTDGAPTPITLDSSNGAATATLHSYTAAPTIGTSVGDVRLQLAASSVLTATPITASLLAPIAVENSVPTPNSLDQYVTLRGTAEGLFINYAGAALTSGFVAVWGVQWVELPNTF
jgi:hypothetical protein